MPESVMINEIMWEYNCTKEKAVQLINKYKHKGKYKELCEIVKFKRCAPDFN